MRDEARKYLAWDSIINGEARISNLTGNRLGQARAETSNADKNVATALVRAYRWTLQPFQRDPQQAKYDFSQAQTDAPVTGEIFRSAFDKFVEDEALVDNISPASLSSMLQQYIWNREDAAERISVDDLWNLLTTNVYLHRLRNREVLENASGMEWSRRPSGTPTATVGTNTTGCTTMNLCPTLSLLFGRLDRVSWSAPRRRPVRRKRRGAKLPLRSRRKSQPRPIQLNALRIILIRPCSRMCRPSPQCIPPAALWPARPPGPIYLWMTSTLSGRRLSAILSSDGGEITVEITISASKPDGFSDGIIRSVRENSAQLGLEFNESDSA